MKIANSIYYFLFLIVLLGSCEKDINVNLPQPEQKIVVEGWIEQNDYPVVMITKSSPYFASVDSASLVDLIVVDAEVTVSDGVTSEVLPLAFSSDIFPPVFFKGKKLKGEIGKTYTLTVKVKDKVYDATTTIPPLVSLDSIWFKKEPKRGDTLGLIWATFTDPPAETNYYRLFTKRLHKDNKFVPNMGSVSDDKFFNGKKFTFSMFRGFATLLDQQANRDDKESGYFKVKDTVLVRVCTIDRPHYDFWFSAEQVMYSGGNPFVYPISVKTNISNGAYGIWGGYGATYYTVIAK